jgi:hypothetical protein
VAFADGARQGTVVLILNHSPYVLWRVWFLGVWLSGLRVGPLCLLWHDWQGQGGTAPAAGTATLVCCGTNLLSTACYKRAALWLASAGPVVTVHV